jgi:hypothetical protein
VGAWVVVVDDRWVDYQESSRHSKERRRNHLGNFEGFATLSELVGLDRALRRNIQPGRGRTR